MLIHSSLVNVYPYDRKKAAHTREKNLAIRFIQMNK